MQDLTRIKINGIKITAAEMVETSYLQKNNNSISKEGFIGDQTNTFEIEAGKMADDVLHIKLFDRLHNMRTVGAKSPEKAMKTVEETINNFIPLALDLGLQEVAEELRMLCLNAIIPNKLHNSKSLIKKNSKLRIIPKFPF